MIDLERMTENELTEEMDDYLKEIKFWSQDLWSHDDDEVAEAKRFIKSAKRRIAQIKKELERRKGVKQ